jgi:hypothetical protein
MALWARRYQWDAGITEDELTGALARIAVDQRGYANRNPAAVLRDRPLSPADYRAGRMIATPLRLYDFALESDGAAAVVLAARPLGGAPDPVWVRGAVQGMFGYAESISVYGELRNGPTYRALGERLLAESGVRVGDLVAASIYDATSISVLLGLEGFGVHAPGAAWRAITEHGIGPDSPLPVNTSGGHLSEAYVHGMNLVIEAVRQCRGDSPTQLARRGRCSCRPARARWCWRRDPARGHRADRALLDGRGPRRGAAAALPGGRVRAGVASAGADLPGGSGAPDRVVRRVRARPPPQLHPGRARRPPGRGRGAALRRRPGRTRGGTAPHREPDRHRPG